MSVISAWSAKATATSEISGPNSVSCSFKGSLVFNVYLSQAESQDAGAPAVPQNSVAGRMAGSIEANVSTPTRLVTGNGTAEWTMGGTYDPLTETITIAIRSSAVDARGLETPLSDTRQGATPVARPFTTRFSWGWQAPLSPWGGGRLPWAYDASNILSAMKASTVPVIPSEREADLYMVNCLPQTGLGESQHLSIDLKEPEPQSVTQTFQDETALGTRTTTWLFGLIPSFNIERDDRTTDGRHSFVSTDSIRLRMAIPGVTVSGSGWANLPSWGVRGLGPFSRTGVPDHLAHSTTFGFRPDPGTRPTGGSTAPNRPIQYAVSAAFEGVEEYFILLQDEADLLRQEYIDHNERVVPSRGDCIAHRVDGSFNVGNYNLVVDGGMQAAFERIKLEFLRGSQGDIRVVGGFRSPQRNKATGDTLTGNAHVYGRALDLVPDSASADALKALYGACVGAGYRSVCEAAPGKEVTESSPEATHVHVEW